MFPIYIVLRIAAYDKLRVLLQYFMVSHTLFQSVNNMCGIGLIGLERLIYIAFPLRYPYIMTRLKVAIMICGMYLFSATFTTLLVLNMDIAKSSFLYFDVDGSRSAFLAWITLALVQYLLLIIFYAIIFRIAYVRQAEMAQHRGGNQYHSASFKIFNMACCVLGIYILSTLPRVLMLLLLCLGVISEEEFHMHAPWIDTFWNLNICLNPVVYVHQNRDFHEAFMKIVPCFSRQICSDFQSNGSSQTKSYAIEMQPVSSI